MKKSISILMVATFLFATIALPFDSARTPIASTAVPSRLIPEVAQVTSSMPAHAGYVRDSVIVQFKAAPTAGAKRRIAAAYGISAEDLSHGVNARQLSIIVPEGQTADGLIAQLAQDPDVLAADRNYVRRVSDVAVAPNDPDYALATSMSSAGVTYANARSWWLRASGSNTAAFWSNYNNAAGAFPVRAAADVFKVAVIDTGFYMNHPDKGANIVVGKDEFQSYHNGVYVKDDDVTPAPETAPMNTRTTAAHGTCVAGEIAAATNNSVGVASVGYDLQVRVYKVMGIWVDGDPANGYPAGSAVILDSAIIDAIYRATDDGCKVINMSLGGTGYSGSMLTAVNYARAHGVVVCAATGNDGASTNFYPAAYAGVVGVGSYGLGSSGAKARSSFTNYGAQLDILAPGVMIYGLTNPSYDPDAAGTTYSPGYEWWQGTSMATPAFAGMLAMVWRFAPALSADEITAYMLSNATSSGTGQPNTSYGYGYVNVAATYAKLQADFPYLAAPGITTTKTAYAAENVNLVWTSVAGRGVSYAVARDGVPATVTTGTSLTLSGVAEGTHTVTITSTSKYNWYDAASDASYTFNVDKTAPVISGISYAADRITWADSEGANPHVTHVRIDAAATQTVAGDAYQIAGGTLADGGHTVRIAETDAVGNVSPVYSAVFTYSNPPATPVLAASYGALSNPFVLTWTADPTAAYQYTLNGGPVVDTPSGSVTLDLADGANAVSVRSIKGGATSPWVATIVNYDAPMPVAPSIQALGTVVAPAASVTWSGVAYAVAYDYRLNGGAIGSTVETAVLVSDLLKGSNTIEVRAKNSGGAGEWAAESFEFAPPIPQAPEIETEADRVAGTSVVITWRPEANAVSYEYELNGIVGSTPITGVSATLEGLVRGDNAIRVRALSAYGDAGPWSQPVKVERSASYDVETTATISAGFGGTGSVVTVFVKDEEGAGVAEHQVALQYSYDNVNWSNLATLTTGVTGTVEYSYQSPKIAWVRPVVTADSYFLTTVGTSVKVSVLPGLGKPSTPSTVTHGRTFIIYGYLKPRHTAGAHDVKIRLYRYRSGKWSYYKTVTTTNANYGSYTRYSVRTSVPGAGSWRAYASYAGTASYSAMTSGYKLFTAK